MSWTDSEGSTALHLAAMGGKLEAVKFLLEAGSKVDAAAANGDTPLHIAATHDFADIVGLLLEHGAAPDAPSKTGTPISQAAANGSDAAIVALITAGADPSAPNAEGVTPLMVASASGKLEATRALLSAGVDVAATGAHGLNALHLACESGNRGVVEDLVGADGGAAAAVAKNDDGLIPIQLAAGRGFEKVVELLLPHSASALADDATVEGLVTEFRAKREAEEKAAAAAAEAKRREDNDEMPLDRMPPEATDAQKEEALAAKARGNEAYGAGDLDAALAAYSEAIALDGRNHVFYGNRSLVNLQRKDFAAAREDGRFARWLNPKWAKGYFHEGRALMAMEDYEAAANAFWQGCRLEPDNKELRSKFNAAIKKAKAAAKK